MSQKQITVSAVQMDCTFGAREHNLKKAEGYVRQAAEQGAQLTLLPELLPYGYGIDESVWEGAETMNGRSISWLKSLAKELHIYIGFSFLEADGEDFYNTFILANPHGKIAGRVRKSPAPAVENYFYKSGNDSHVIETELGRIGVNICYEMLLHENVNELYYANIDLCLQPSAAARCKQFIPGDQKRLTRSVISGRKHHHTAWGVPVVMANRVGKLEGALPSRLMGYLKTSFMGGSYISDSDGKVLKEMDTENEEGVIVATITLDPNYKSKTPPKRYGKIWSLPMPWFSFTLPMTEPWGEKSYKGNARRKALAKKTCKV